DPLPVEAPKDPETNHVFNLYKLFATPAERDALAARFRAGGLGYGHAKQALVDLLERELGPARARYDALVADRPGLDRILADGAARARRRPRRRPPRPRSRGAAMTKRKTLVVLYPGCISYEVQLAAELLHPHMPVEVATPDGADHAGSNGMRVRADMA